MNKKIFGVILLNVLSVFCLRAQTTIYAVADGTWTSNTSASFDIWSTDPLAALPDAGLRPTSVDDVFTNGFHITIGSGATCSNLGVSYDEANSLIFGSLLTITGTLSGWDDAIAFPTAPSTNVFSGNPLLRFSTVNVGTNPFIALTNNEIIGFWNKNTPLGAVVIALTKDVVIDGGDPFFGGDSELQATSFNISGGTALNPWTITNGSNITGIRISGASGTTFSLSANNEVDVTIPIYGTVDFTSRTGGTTQINGTFRTSSFLNGTTVNIGAAGYLETTSTGADQTQGWWYQSNAPTTIGTSTGSTVAYAGSGDQEVYLRAYSNLILSGSGNKSLVGSAGSVGISRSLSIGNGVTFSSTLATAINIGGDLVCDGTWSPSHGLTFNGASPITAQEIRGSGSLSLNSLTVSSSSITLTISRSVSISNGLTINTSATLNLGSGTVTTVSAGNIVNNGTVTATGELLVSGTSIFSGTGTTTLANVSIGQAPTTHGNLTVQSVVSINNLSVSTASSYVSFEASPTFRGNISNSGTIDFANNAIVTFSGGTAQSISGNALNIYDMVVNKSSNTVTNNTVITLSGNLTMTSGTLDVDGTGQTTDRFILLSDVNRDATIGKMTGGQITGEVTFQRYFNNTANRWRNIGFPVTGVTITKLSSSFQINNRSIAYYNESTAGNIDQGWTYLTGGVLPEKRGHSVYMYNLLPITISIKGSLQQNVPAVTGSLYDFNVTYTNDPGQPASQDGWNLVANPFACPIDWAAASGWVKTNVNSVAAVWDATTAAYRYSGTASWDGIVAQGQGFWVQTNASSPALQCSEDVKRSDMFDPSFYRARTEDVNEKLNITLSQGSVFDETIIQFKDSSDTEFDGRYDAHKLSNQIFNLSSITPKGLDLAINVLPKTECAKNVKLNISNIKAGEYTLKFENVSSFHYRLVLIDKFLNTAVELTDKYIYTFSVSDATGSFGKDRFVVSFEMNDLPVFDAPVLSRTGRKLSVTSSQPQVEWMLNGAQIIGATGNTLIATKQGVYEVVVSNQGCLVKSNAITVGKASTNRAFPVPASEVLNVDVSGVLEKSAQKTGYIELVSIRGVSILKHTFSLKDDIISLEVDRIPPGLYQMKIHSGNKLLSIERIIIQ